MKRYSFLDAIEKHASLEDVIPGTPEHSSTLSIVAGSHRFNGGSGIVSVS